MRKMLALLPVVALAGCVEHGECLSSHTELQTVTIPVYTLASCGSGCSVMVNAGMIPVTRAVNVCDRWEFPEGRK